jgi:hypothetical protein
MKIKRNSSIPLVDNLTELVRMPRNRDILGRFVKLRTDLKERGKRISFITEELQHLWNKFSFPTVSKPLILKKVKKIVAEYESNRRRKSSKFQNKMSTVFNITKTDGLWLSSEDKLFYKSQKESGGQVGYATGKPAPLSSIHPSKRACLIQSKATTSDAVPETSNSDISDTDSQSQSAYSNISSSCSSSQLIYNSTSSASKLVTQNSLSTHQAFKVCNNLSAEGFTLRTPSQSVVWRSVIRAGEKNKKKIKAILRDGTSYCLHFDGTKISQQEYKVVILQNEERQINLEILKCQSGKAEDI